MLHPKELLLSFYSGLFAITDLINARTARLVISVLVLATVCIAPYVVNCVRGRGRSVTNCSVVGVRPRSLHNVGPYKQGVPTHLVAIPTATAKASASKPTMIITPERRTPCFPVSVRILFTLAQACDHCHVVAVVLTRLAQPKHRNGPVRVIGVRVIRRRSAANGAPSKCVRVCCTPPITWIVIVGLLFHSAAKRHALSSGCCYEYRCPGGVCLPPPFPSPILAVLG